MRKEDYMDGAMMTKMMMTTTKNWLEDLDVLIRNQPSADDTFAVNALFQQIHELTYSGDRLRVELEKEINLKQQQYLESLDIKSKEWALVKNSSTLFTKMSSNYVGDAYYLHARVEAGLKQMSAILIGYSSLLKKI